MNCRAHGPHNCPFDMNNMPQEERHQSCLHFKSHVIGEKKHVGKGLIEKVNLSQVYSAFHLRKQSSRLFPVWEQVLRVNAWATCTLPARVRVQASLRDKNDPHKCLVLSCSVVSFFFPQNSHFSIQILPLTTNITCFP